MAFDEATLAGQIAQDRNWRLKEISDLKAAILQADRGLQQVLLRALVTICYAHWEGSVKFSAKRYLEYVARRKLNFGQLNRQYVRNYFLPRLAELSKQNTSLSQRCKLIDEILDSSSARFGRVNDELINTKSNLNSDLFLDICLICGISSHQFEEKRSFIDVLLLKRRNSIAHGEDTLVGIDDLEIMANETIALMRGFGDALENLIYLNGYRAA